MARSKEIAEAFGVSLDQDDFERCKTLLDANCIYVIGDETLNGPTDIAGSYEANMIAGRKKLDKLEWGQSRIEALNDGTFFVHFTDYLTHKGEAYMHRCKQRLTIEDNKVTRIEHIHDETEQQALNGYYKGVGLL